MLAIYAIHWSRGNWGATKSFPTTCLLGVVARNAGICWNRMTLFISLFTIKTAKLKTSGFVEKPRVFFHILRFCRFLSFEVYIYPPCIAHYKVDILCAYKVGFRSPLYIPTMGDKAVFCARNMPLDLEDEGVHEMTAMSWKLGEGSTERSFTKVYIVEVPLSLFPECKLTTLFSNSKFNTVF